MSRSLRGGLADLLAAQACLCFQVAVVRLLLPHTQDSSRYDYSPQVETEDCLIFLLVGQ
jgi:hypothetical protein